MLLVQSWMLPNEVSSSFRVIAPGWIKVAAGYLSRFLLAVGVGSIITALCHSSLSALLIPSVFIGILSLSRS